MALTTRLGSKKPAAKPTSRAPRATSKKSKSAPKEAAPALTASEAKMLKELEAKKKAVEAAKAEAEKQVSRKRTAALLALEEEEREGGDTEPEDEEPPPSTQPRTKRLRREGAVSSLDDLWDEPEPEGPAPEDDSRGEGEQEEAAGTPQGEDGREEPDGEEVNAGGDEDNDEIVSGPEEDQEKKKAPTSESTSKRQGPKVTLSAFSTPRSARVAKHGHSLMRRFISLTDAFPLVTQKHELCWTALSDAGKNDKSIKTFISGLDDEDKKKDWIDYAWGAVTQLRGELVMKARLAVPHAYNLPGGLKGDELVSAVRWLVDDGKMLHRDINLKERTCDEDGVWAHPIFAQLIKAQWWSQRGKGTRLGNTSSNPYLNAPIPQLALVATAVNCVLTGIGTGTNLEFNDSLFRGKFQGYVKMLKVFEEKCPSYLKMIQSNIQEETGVQAVASCSYSFDFASLEAKAKPVV